jgi:dTDP-4-amino-4,6-dideoxygalactose transaminase
VAGIVTPIDRAVIPMVRPEVEGVDELAATLAAILRSGRLTNGGPFLAEFEAALARSLGADDAVAVTNGAIAIDLAIEAAGVPRGRAILPAFTFIATLNAAVHAGFEPVFCDIDRETWTLDPDHLARLLAQHGATLILPVNAFGVPPALDEIAALAGPAGAAVIYDCAHGMGTAAGPDAAALTRARTLSFHATKVLVAAEAGAVLSADREVLARARRLRNHGLAQPTVVAHAGFNAKLDELRAAVGLASLRRLPEVLARRRSYFDRLRAALSRHPGVYRVQRIPDGVRPNGQNLGAWLPGREIDAAIAAFARHGVEARRYFYPPLHTIPQIPGLAARPELPRTEALCASQICLPLHGRMDEQTLQQIEAAIDAVASELAPA